MLIAIILAKSDRVKYNKIIFLCNFNICKDVILNKKYLLSFFLTTFAPFFNFSGQPYPFFLYTLQEFNSYKLVTVNYSLFYIYCIFSNLIYYFI